jgi:hypothetical protein
MIGEVDEGAGWGGHGDLLANRGVTGPVNDDTGSPTATAARGHRDLDPRGATRTDAPQDRGAAVAEGRAVTERKDGTEEAAVVRETRMAYRVHVSMNPVQPARSDSAVDCAAIEPERLQLRACDDPVLSRRQPPNAQIRRGFVEIYSHTE